MPTQPSTLSNREEKILALIPILPTLLSVFGSSVIVYLVLQDTRKSPYKRILFALSLSDIVSSLNCVFQQFAMPRNTSYRVWAFGNEKTCSAAGTLQQLGFCAFWYNGALSLYYLLTIRFGVTERTFSKWVEPCVHVVSVSYSVITACVGLALDAYHEVDVSRGCWLSDYPKGCDVDESDSLDCKSVMLGMVFAGYPFALALGIIIVGNILIYRHVRKTTKQSQRLEWSSSGESSRQANVRAVASQSVWYVAGFLMTYSCGVVLRLMEGYDITMDEATLLPLLVLNAFFLPMLGFFNLFIFIRPRYLRMQKSYPDESRLNVFQRVIKNERCAVRQLRRATSVRTGGSTDSMSPSFTLVHTPPMTQSSDASPNTPSIIQGDESAPVPDVEEG